MKKSVLIFSLLISLFSFSCIEHEYSEIILKDITNITDSSATVTCQIYRLSDDAPFEYGICYSKEISPNIYDNKIDLGLPSIKEFSEIVEGLDSNATYYFRGYILDENGASYSNQESITTIADTTSAK